MILYHLSVLPLPRSHQLALQQSLSKLLWGGGKPMVCRQVCCQHLSNGGLGMPDLENHWFAERLAYLGWSLSTDMMWRWNARNTFLCLKSDSKAESRRKPKGEALFTREYCKALRNLPGSSDFSQSQKELYQELVMGSASDPVMDRLGWLMVEVLALELGTRFGLLEQFQALANLAACTECITLFRLEFQSMPGRHVPLSLLQQWLRRNSWAHLLLRASSSILGSCWRVDGSHQTQAAHAAQC